MNEEVENEIKEVFKNIEVICEKNSLKVLNAFQNNNISTSHFNGTTGYGYGDTGRDIIEKVFAEILKAEDALVRTQMISRNPCYLYNSFCNFKTRRYRY